MFFPPPAGATAARLLVSHRCGHLPNLERHPANTPWISNNRLITTSCYGTNGSQTGLMHQNGHPVAAYSFSPLVQLRLNPYPRRYSQNTAYTCTNGISHLGNRLAVFGHLQSCEVVLFTGTRPLQV